MPALDGEAVLDKETGLVWERAPIAEAVRWPNADDRCRDTQIGGRKGWRLPQVSELQTLDIQTGNQQSLLEGHPLSGVDPSYEYWTSTNAGNGAEDYNWTVIIGSPVTGALKTDLADHIGHIWCVRG